MLDVTVPGVREKIALREQLMKDFDSYRRQHEVAEKKVVHITSDAGRKAAEAKRDAYKKKLDQATALYNNADRGVKAELKRLAHQRREPQRRVLLQ